MACNPPVTRAQEYKFTPCHPPMNPELSKILQESGWGNGFKIPFANAENKELEKLLDQKQRRYVELASLREDDKAHLENVKKHYTRVQHDLAVYQHLITAKRLECGSAQRATSFAERLLSHERQDRDRTQKLMQDVTERTQEKLKKLKTRKEGVVELMNLSEFNGRALQKWEEKTKLSEHEIKDIQNFISQDSELNTNLEKRTLALSATHKSLSRLLDEKSLDTNKLQTEFNRTTARFQKEHRHRNRLIRMWRSSVEAMKYRDEELAEIAEVYREIRQSLRNLDIKCREKEDLLNEERRNTRYTRHVRSELERKINNVRQTLLKLQDMESSFRSDYVTQQGVVAHNSGDVQEVRKRIEALDAEIKSLEKRAAAVEAESIVLRSRLESALSFKGDSKDSLREMEEMLDKQWGYCNHLEHDIKRYRQEVYEIHCVKTEIEQELHNKTETINKNRKILGFYASKEFRNNEMLTRIRGSIFQAELRATQLESRIDRFFNESVVAAGYLEKQSRVQTLKKVLERTIKDARFLSHELQHDVSVVYKFNRKIVEGLQVNDKENQELKHLNLYCISLENSIKTTQEGIRDRQVELSMNKVIVRRLESLLQAEMESISSLTLQRMTIAGAIKERAEEIATHTHLNKAIRKHVKEDINQLKIHLNDTKKHVDAQMGSFRKIWALFQSDKEEETSFTDSVLNLAREREELAQQRDLWESKLEEIKKEIEGLRNNVKLMDTSNCQLKISLSPATPESIEHQKMLEMERAEKTALVRKHHASQRLKKLNDEADILHTSIHSVKQQILQVGFTCHAKMRLASLLGGEVITQQDKIHRWTNLGIMLLVEIRKNLPKSLLRQVEADLKLRFLEEKFEFAVVMVEKLIGFFPETRDKILHFLHHEKMFLSDMYTRIATDLKVGFKNNPTRRVTLAAAIKNVNSTSYAHLVHNAHANNDEALKHDVPKPDATTRRPSRKSGFKAKFSILKVDRH